MWNPQSTAELPYGERLQPFFRAAAPITHALFRFGAAILFMQHGVQKLLGWLGGVDGAGATAPMLSMFWFAGILEVFGGLLILLGVLTRPIAVVLLIEMLVAYGIAHMPQGGWPIENGGELALLFAAAFTFLFGNGAGPFSVDAWLASRREGRLGPPRPAVVERGPRVERRPGRERDTAA